MNKFIISIFFLLIVGSICAHQPNIVEGNGKVEITNPEISKAFYGNLNGSPAVFEIKSDQEFKLYVGITVPVIKDIKTDKSVQISVLDNSGKEKEIYLLNATQDWLPFYEEFGGDTYFKGPEIRAKISAGNYGIRV